MICYAGNVNINVKRCFVIYSYNFKILNVNFKILNVNLKQLSASVQVLQYVIYRQHLISQLFVVDK